MDAILSEPSMLVPIGALGLVFGSFVTALSYRVPRGESISRGRSRCPSCGHVLEVPDLVPVLSWLMHGGRCRHCHTNIPWRYPLIEMTTMALFIVAGISVANPVSLFLVLAMTPIMVTLAIIDLEHQRLPNGLVLLLAVLALAWRWNVDRGIVAGFGVGVITFATGWLLDHGFRKVMRQQGLGMGDAKLFAAAALAFPMAGFLIFVLMASLCGVAFGLVWRWRTKANVFPFAPAALTSYWLCLVAADKIMRHLMNLASG